MIKTMTLYGSYMQLSCIRLDVVTTSGPRYLWVSVWDPVINVGLWGFVRLGLWRLRYIWKMSINTIIRPITLMVYYRLIRGM